MSYTRFNIDEELQKVARGQKTKVDPYVLLRLVIDDLGLDDLGRYEAFRNVDAVRGLGENELGLQGQRAA